MSWKSWLKIGGVEDFHHVQFEVNTENRFRLISLTCIFFSFFNQLMTLEVITLRGRAKRLGLNFTLRSNLTTFFYLPPPPPP